VDERRRSIPIEGPYDLIRSLRPLADGGGDPTWSFRQEATTSRAMRAMWTPVGPASVELDQHASTVSARAAGPGAGWVLDRLELLTGLADDPTGFPAALHPRVAEAHRRLGGLRLARSLALWDVIVPVVLGQRVTTGEARRSWLSMVRRHGHPAPATNEVRLPPRPEEVARLGDDEWHRLGVERSRADAVRGLVRVLPALERLAADPSPAGPARTAAFRRVAETVRRVGPWTSTSLGSAVLGDPDLVLLGDLHVPHTVCHALSGQARGDDARMLELLEPFRPHRGRVVRLLKASGRGAPRFGPRRAPLPIAEL
jgi:3-methyladenine DNA glycosylase/8-oxoguanine DNA glycosylase